MEKKQKFIISGTNDTLWNQFELIDYLIKNQNKCITLQINPEAIDLNNLGIYQLLDSFNFQQVDIHTENQLEFHDNYNIIITCNNKWLAHTLTIQPDLHTWTGNKKFLVFYHRPTANRLGLASYLFTHYKDQSSIHFSSGTDVDSLALYEFDKLASYRLESIDEVANMLPHVPLYCYQNHEILNHWARAVSWHDDDAYDPGFVLYQDIFVDIISEPHVLGNTFYPTEKTARPIWLKKPFVVFGSRDYLDYLHQMGFKTFCEFWDETYDGFEGRDRFVKILTLIDWLAQKSVTELQKMYSNMQPILEHNYNLLQTQSYNKTITKIT